MTPAEAAAIWAKLGWVAALIIDHWYVLIGLALLTELVTRLWDWRHGRLS